jgi:Pilus assembly protein, PilO
MKKKSTPQSVWIAAIVGGLLLVTVLGYFVVVSPERGKAADLQKQISATQKQIDDARALVAKAKSTEKVKVADLFKLTTAMPDSPSEADVLLDLNSVAQAAGIEFSSIAVDPSAALSSYIVIPMRLEFVGNFYALSDFLFRLRNLVDVRRGALDASGRLFAVDQIALDEGVYTFPRIRAQITLDAFVYGLGTPGSNAPAQSSASTSAPATTAPSASTTTPSTTPPPAAAPAAASTGTGGTQ